MLRHNHECLAFGQSSWRQTTVFLFATLHGTLVRKRSPLSDSFVFGKRHFGRSDFPLHLDYSFNGTRLEKSRSCCQNTTLIITVCFCLSVCLPASKQGCVHARTRGHAGRHACLHACLHAGQIEPVISNCCSFTILDDVFDKCMESNFSLYYRVFAYVVCE